MADAGILRIEKHDDRLCFRNPGLLKLPVEAIYRGGNSKARNPKIQNMLRMIGFGENVGFGFPKIIAAWKEPLGENSKQTKKRGVTPLFS